MQKGEISDPEVAKEKLNPANGDQEVDLAQTRGQLWRNLARAALVVAAVAGLAVYLHISKTLLGSCRGKFRLHGTCWHWGDRDGDICAVALHAELDQLVRRRLDVADQSVDIVESHSVYRIDDVSGPDPRQGRRRLCRGEAGH